ncbi:MAG: hypothetical protein LQ351_006407 [Letrouitia transgressa]|nr:MAG: hypothetical protein LQ351_006407 [Letrouitia transgressa]
MLQLFLVLTPWPVSSRPSQPPDDQRTGCTQTPKDQCHNLPPAPIPYIPGNEWAGQHPSPKSKVEKAVPLRISLVPLPVCDSSGDLAHHRHEDARKSQPDDGQQRAKQNFLRQGVVGDEAEADERRGRKEKAQGGRPLGTVPIAQVTDDGTKEGGDEKGQEAEACGRGMPAESRLDEESQDSVKGGE